MILVHAHADARFAERIYTDLVGAKTGASYERVALGDADSALARLRHRRGRSCLVGLISAASIDSYWVRDEFSAPRGDALAKVGCLIPVVVGTCSVPPPIIAGGFADFRAHYFRALAGLLDTVRERLGGGAASSEAHGQYLCSCQSLEDALDARDAEQIFAWCNQYPAALASLTGSALDSVTAVPALEGRPPSRSFAAWTPSTDYLWHLVELGPLSSSLHEDTVWAQATELASRAQAYARNLRGFVQACALTPGGDALFKVLGALYPDGGLAGASYGYRQARAVLKGLILLTGRRQDHHALSSAACRAMRLELGVNVVPYEWLVEAAGAATWATEDRPRPFPA